MTTDKFIEKIALFYHFSFLDEVRAQAATEKTIKKYRREYFAAQLVRKELSSVDFVRLTTEQLAKEKKNVRPTNLAFTSGELVLPEKSNFGPWFEFRKLADDKDFIAVLYSRVVGITEGCIAQGMNLSQGTVRFRIAKGLKILGRICHLGGNESES